jgi:D-3-phosphoglycerate dehydrogenase
MAILGLLTLVLELHFKSYLQTFENLKPSYDILIIDDVHSVLVELLADHSVRYLPNCTLQELPELLKDAEILILRSKLRLDKHWIDQAPNLKCIARLGSGMDNIDEAYAKERAIVCFNAPEGNRNAVAEQTIGVLLSLLSNVYRSANQVKRNIWDRKGNQGIELSELTLGIIGYGNVGSELAKRLAGFNCKILAYDKFKTGFGTDRVEECSLDKLQKEADIVTLHVSLNPSSDKMINQEFIEKMEKPFYILNLARGGVIDTAAIIAGLKSNKILGCGLDVFVNEKLETLSEIEKKWFEYLVTNDKVILTPHIGGLTSNSYCKLGTVLADKILKWAKNGPLVN